MNSHDYKRPVNIFCSFHRQFSKSSSKNVSLFTPFISHSSSIYNALSAIKLSITISIKPCNQWRLLTRVFQGKCSGRTTSALAAAMAVKCGNIKIVYQYILTLLMRLMNCLCPAMRSGLAPPPLPANQFQPVDPDPPFITYSQQCASKR